MPSSEASFRGACGWRDCQEQKQVSIETFHQELKEIIHLLQDLRRNQLAFYAAEHYQMTPRADEELYKLVCNGLKPFGFDPKGD